MDTRRQIRRHIDMGLIKYKIYLVDLKGKLQTSKI